MILLFSASGWYHSLCNIITNNLNKKIDSYLLLVWQRNRLTLHESTHNGFLQIMHPRTFHINNPSDAKLASLSILIKWPVSMATIVKIEKKQKVTYLGIYSTYFHNISF